MHEIAKYFLLTEIQEQCLNPVPATRSGPSRLTEHQTHVSVHASVAFQIKYPRNSHTKTHKNTHDGRGHLPSSGAARAARLLNEPRASDSIDLLTFTGLQLHAPRLIVLYGNSDWR